MDKATLPRQQHWINQCTSQGCEIVLWSHKYTIWLSNNDWKQALKDAETIIAALTSVELPLKEFVE